jgi:uncharacterized protein
MTMNYETAEELVEHLELERHIEGGYFRETYRAQEIVETPRGPRSGMTNIYYCLPSNDFSVWHKLIDLEETFHYHWGDSALIYRIVDRKITTDVLGPSAMGGQTTVVMPPNTWFAIRPSGLKTPAAYTLMSCSVVPGFDYEDLVIGDRSLLDELYESEHKLAISLLKAQNI